MLALFPAVEVTELVSVCHGSQAGDESCSRGARQLCKNVCLCHENPSEGGAPKEEDFRIFALRFRDGNV